VCAATLLTPFSMSSPQSANSDHGRAPPLEHNHAGHIHPMNAFAISFANARSRLENRSLRCIGSFSRKVTDDA
jgi:hypothetical protein